jgi:hypothetical protein
MNERNTETSCTFGITIVARARADLPWGMQAIVLIQQNFIEYPSKWWRDASPNLCVPWITE